MQQKVLWPASVMLGLFLMAVHPQRVSAANVMNYGADGNDYFQFTTPSMACDKASGFTTLITFAMHVDADGTLEIAGVACTNGVYVGPTNWNTLLTTLKTPPTTVTRYEVAIGGWQDTSYDNIKSLINSQGNGPTSMLYKNFQALKNAVPGIDAFNDDDEKTYDVSSTTNFANMLGGLGFKFTTVPYTQQAFWVKVNNAVTNCDYIYLQCYEGGAGNDPGSWNTAFGHGVKVIPGQESNTANPATWRSWFLETGTQGGFFYPDVVFSTTYWSAMVYQANGTVTAAPTGVTAVAGGQQVSLAWNTVPGAISYNIKRSTVSGGETTVMNISTINNNWPSSNQYIDIGLAGNVTYYYEITGVNTNGEGAASIELSAIPQPASVFNFESPYIGTGNYLYNPSGGPWIFSGASPNGSGLVSQGSAFGNPNAPGTNQQAGFVQESRRFPGPSPGLLRAPIIPSPFPPQNAVATVRRGMSKWIAASSAVTTRFAATAFADYTASFTATALTHTLQFVGTDLPGGDNTVFISNVRISPPLIPLPLVAANTSPSTATDVVGNQVTFTAGFGGQQPMAYQWKMIKAGVTNLISGATNATPGFFKPSGEQLGFLLSAGFQTLSAVALSTPAALTVNSAPASVNNVITAMSAQTGLGGGIFTPTWGITPGSLIAGQAPSTNNGSLFAGSPRDDRSTP